MIEKSFFDTNVLVYGYDDADPRKRDAARHLVHESLAAGRGAVSTQVMHEFYVCVTRKGWLSPMAAKSILAGFRSFEIVAINPDMVLDAVDCSVTNQISF